LQPIRTAFALGTSRADLATLASRAHGTIKPALACRALCTIDTFLALQSHGADRTDSTISARIALGARRNSRNPRLDIIKTLRQRSKRLTDVIFHHLRKRTDDRRVFIRN
jgi:hypothetical protein